MIIDFSKKNSYDFHIDYECSTSKQIACFVDGISEPLHFAPVAGRDSLRHKMYFLNCLLSFDPANTNGFKYSLKKMDGKVVMPELEQLPNDAIEHGKILQFNPTLIPKNYATLKKEQFTDVVCNAICNTFLDHINKKYFDYISKEEPKNDILITVEKIDETIVTAVETMPVIEPKTTEQLPQSTGIENTLTSLFQSFASLKNEANEKIKILNNPKISTSDLANQNSLFCDIITKVGDLKSSIEDVICDSDNDLDALLIEQKENFAQLCVSKSEKYTTAGADAYSEAQTISDRSFLKKFKAFKSNVDTFYKDLSRKFSAIVQIISERKQTRNLNE